MVSKTLAVLAVAAASIFNGAFALPHRGRHAEKHARDVVVVNGPMVKEFVVVDQYGQTVSVSRTTIYPATTAPATTKRRKQKAKTTSVVQEPVYEAPAPTTAAPPVAETSQAAAASSAAPAPVTGEYDTATLGKGLVFSPYHDDHTCKTLDQVRSDMKIAFTADRGYKWVRIYGADCSQVKNVVTVSYELGLKVMLGVYNVKQGAGPFNEELQTLISDVKAANKASGKAETDWSQIALVSIGNEWVNENGGAQSAVDDLVAYMKTARTALRAAGYKNSVSTADVWIWYKTFPQLCGDDKMVPINMHPFFDQSCSAESSGAFLKNNLAAIQDACGSSKKVFIAETGWPHGGNQYFNAIPSPQNQEKFVTQAAENLDTYILMTAFNEKWKSENSAARVEKLWGLYGDSPSN